MFAFSLIFFESDKKYFCNVGLFCESGRREFVPIFGKVNVRWVKRDVLEGGKVEEGFPNAVATVFYKFEKRGRSLTEGEEGGRVKVGDNLAPIIL